MYKNVVKTSPDSHGLVISGAVEGMNIPALAEEAVRLDWLQPTVKHGRESHAVITVIQEAFSRQSSACHRIKKNRLGHLPRTSWTRGICICFRACPFLGSWRALLCEEVRVRAGRGCSVFWRIDDWRISLQENGTSEMLRRS